jgi:putative membrane-bound dehydrogenase-like protein
VGHHARVQLARLDRGEELGTKVDYPVQTWSCGDALSLVFLSGEVVADYALRLKRERDGLRLWINAYANGVPCYIPSERVLKVGGYEGRGAMTFYDLPAPFQPGLEQKIVDTVHKQLGTSFKPPFDPQRTQVLPLSPQQSRGTIRPKPGMIVELMAAEPLVVSPVAIDFGPDGRLWVAEMIDYPMGTKGDYRPGGRVRVLEDTDGDGKYDKATVFLDNIPFPTGLTVWRKGALIAAAPDILYAEDTDGDGKADLVRKLYSGFGTENYQARVNSLHYGLDGWVHGSCGAFGGTIRSFAGGEPFPLGNRDFRIKPDSGALEPAAGRTQQGRERDDWGNWFGCTNGQLCFHYPLADHYLRRNPYSAPPVAAVQVPQSTRLYPTREEVQRFKLSGVPNQPTAACGLGVYRDDLLGAEYTGDTFTCEPVHLLVHRLKMAPSRSSFIGQRAADEQQSEFLSATDNWSRPVQVRTGPDGCLWVVDMYRYVIEHPRWIPPEELARVDARAGHNLGRIYRVRPADRGPRPFTRLDRLDTAGLVAALDSPNGWQRDLAGQMLLWKGDASAGKPLEELAAKSTRAEARLHALCVLDGLKQLRASTVLATLGDPHPGVRRHAVRLGEQFLSATPELGAALLKRIDDPDAQVRLQLACSLGEWPESRSGRALAALALRDPADLYLTAAVLSSVHSSNVEEVVLGVLDASGEKGPPVSLAQRLIGVATALAEPRALSRLYPRVFAGGPGRFAPWQMAALAGMLSALDQRGQALNQLADEKVRTQVGLVLDQARSTVAAGSTPVADRLAAVQVLGRVPDQRGTDLAVLGKLLVPQNAQELQAAALTALGRIPDAEVARVVLAGWQAYTPALRTQVLDLLLSRDAWQRQLLTSLEKNEVSPGHIDAARRQRLLAHKDPQFQGRAGKLFAGATSKDRQKVLDDYRASITLAGDRERGKVIFVRACAACHRLHDVGHAVGPDLATLFNKGPEYFLIEILDPNRNVDSRYIDYVAVTRAGQTFSGILASESATSITLKGQEGKLRVLLRSELEEFRSTGKSLMPEGLEKDLSRQDMADLIACITSPRS